MYIYIHWQLITWLFPFSLRGFYTKSEFAVGLYTASEISKSTKLGSQSMTSFVVCKRTHILYYLNDFIAITKTYNYLTWWRPCGARHITT